MRLVRIFAVLALLLTAFTVGAQERLAMPQWEWRILDAEQITLWCNGAQQGNYFIDTGTYLPYLGARKWGVPEDPPCPVPQPFLRQIDPRKNWRTNGVISADGKPEVPHTGLHIRKTVPPPQAPKGKSAPRPMPPKSLMQDYPPGAIRFGSDQVPDYSTMPSLTFVAKDPAVADAALQMFQSAPELAPWRDKYGARAKAYGEEDFRHTSYAFKLDEDRTFQQSGFVALVQGPPDKDGRAVPSPIYECSSPAQFASALRDADQDYDPNQPSGGAAAQWQTSHLVAAGTFLAIAVVCAAVGLGMKHRPRRLL